VDDFVWRMVVCIRPADGGVSRAGGAISLRVGVGGAAMPCTPHLRRILPLSCRAAPLKRLHTAASFRCAVFSCSRIKGAASEAHISAFLSSLCALIFRAAHYLRAYSTSPRINQQGQRVLAQAGWLLRASAWHQHRERGFARQVAYRVYRA